MIYGYDAIGSYDTMEYGAQDSGIELVIPVLDNQMTGRNQLISHSYGQERTVCRSIMVTR